MTQINYRDFIASMIDRKMEIDRPQLHEVFQRFVDPEDPRIVYRSLRLLIGLSNRFVQSFAQACVSLQSEVSDGTSIDFLQLDTPQQEEAPPKMIERRTKNKKTNPQST